MDQKTKPWAFPKPHPENTPRGERNKQEFDVAPDTETRAQGASEESAQRAGTARS